MADLVSIFGGPFTLETRQQAPPLEHQIADAMQAQGITPPHPIQIDGKLHRFRAGTKGQGGHGDKTGWYVIYPDGIPAGKFGCWRAGIEQNWRAEIGRTLTQDEEMRHARRLAEAKAARDAELAKSREVAANTVEQIWANATGASPDHPYLVRKGVQPHGARLTGDGRLVVPLYGADGALSSLQYISHDGGKLYHSKGETGGKFWQVGTTDEPGTIYIAEGFATAATIHEATHRPCFIAFSAHNMPSVALSVREMIGATGELVVVGDNDESGVGQKYAADAAAKASARLVIPPEPGDANDFVAAGYDLAALLTPQPDDWLQSADSLCDQPAPIAWLIKRWLQDKALMMLHGPSGVGKTFILMDMCLRIATGKDDWNGFKVRPGMVVYLAGEGHYGLRGRIAAWKHHHKAGKINMWVSRHGCDLNTPQGFQKVRDAIRALPETPSLIVVDTLHRFLAGDENSAQDAKTMIDACDRMKHEFGCSVMLVHHTGVSDEAQHRARGSSAWRGALDIEISVTGGKNDAPIKIEPRKVKDGEEPDPIYCDLESITIPGWLDEDGEPVRSAVPVIVSAPPKVAKQKRKGQSEHEQKLLIRRAWYDTGCEVRTGKPYVARAGLKLFLTKNRIRDEDGNEIDGPGHSGETAKRYVKKSGHAVSALLDLGWIAEHEHGYIIEDQYEAGDLLLSVKSVQGERGK
jgi:putative DNA primase/helicase